MTLQSLQTFEDVPLSLIDDPADILREDFNTDEMGQLADSIAAEGLHQPIGLKPTPGTNRYKIAWGHRRYMAHVLLHRPTIRAEILPDDADTLLYAISENLQRSNLTPIEEALAIQRLHDRGQDVTSIARLMRRSQPWVISRLHLLTLPHDLMDAIRTRTLTMAVAAALAPVDDEKYRRLLIEEARRTGASAASAGLWAQHYEADKGRIVANTCTIEEINSRREAWRYMIDCEICKTPTPYEDTRSIRLCTTCFAVADEALTGEQEPTAAMT